MEVAKELKHVLSVSAVSTSTVNGLAHYDSEVGANPYLGTGYVDNGGTFQPIHGTNSLTLTSTFKIKIGINWKLKTVAPTEWGWNAGYDQYTEDGITYTLTEIINNIKTKTVDVFVKPSSGSRVRMYTTAAVSGDTNFANIASAADAAEEGKVHTKAAQDTTGYYFLDAEVALSNLNGTTQASPKYAETAVSACSYYMYGRKDASDNNKDTEAVAGSLDVIVINHVA